MKSLFLLGVSLSLLPRLAALTVTHEFTFNNWLGSSQTTKPVSAGESFRLPAFDSSLGILTSVTFGGVMQAGFVAYGNNPNSAQTIAWTPQLTGTTRFAVGHLTGLQGAEERVSDGPAQYVGQTVQLAPSGTASHRVDVLFEDSVTFQDAQHLAWFTNPSLKLYGLGLAEVTSNAPWGYNKAYASGTLTLTYQFNEATPLASPRLLVAGVPDHGSAASLLVAAVLGLVLAHRRGLSLRNA
jgi:hypothetical protein